MPILPRYLLRLFTPTFLISLTVFIAVLLMNHFVSLFQLAVSKGISLWWVWRCFGYLAPSLLSLAIPMSYLVALLVTLGQFSEDGEVMALRASGYSFLGILWPFIVLGMLLSGLLLYLNHVESPAGFNRFKNARAIALEQFSRLEVEPKSFLTLGDWKLYAQEVDQTSHKLKSPILFRYKNSDLSLRVHAKEGTYLIEKGKGLTLIFKSGELQKSDAEDPRKLLVANFQRYKVFIPTAGPSQVQREPAMQEMRSSHILSVLKNKDITIPRRAELRTEFTVRSVLGLAPLVFFWIGCALGLSIEKRSRAWGFVLSLVVLFIYYALFVFGISMGRRYISLSLIIPWLADWVVLAGGIYLWWRNIEGR
ncbi:MAG: LptF/LptG family permease [Elusimicrobia bacterium]|nr:LptF/LptG family permease [Elusimicrobiota bacterium]